MKTNKWVSIFGISILAFGLTACSETNNNGEIKEEPSAREENQPNEPEDQEPDDTEEDLNDSEENERDNDPTITALVNKQYSLDEDYVPDDLVTVEVPTVLDDPEVKQLREVAAHALQLMFNEAEESSIYLHARSGYRSYQTQVQLFKNYAEAHGEEAANRYSARPGQSEHQTGLVMDVTSESVNFQLEESFGETAEGKWLSEHAHEFGFIIRYPKGEEDVTGYIYEPWHIRYLGEDMATKVYESGLTYEEYLEEEGMIDEVIS